MLALVSLARPTRVLGWLQLGLGGVALVASIVIALDQISTANHVVQQGAARTSYQPGAPLAVAASAAILVTSIIALTHKSQPRSG